MITRLPAPLTALALAAILLACTRGEQTGESAESTTGTATQAVRPASPQGGTGQGPNAAARVEPPLPELPPGDYAGTPIPAPGELGGPRTDLDEEQMRRFELGRIAFTARFTHEVGLGPYWETTSCANCHFMPVVGGVARQVKFNSRGPDGEPLAHQPNHLPDFPPNVPPEGAYPLRPPPLFGVGLLAAVPDEVVIAGCDPDDADGDGVRGRAHVWGGRLLRLGSKAHDPNPRSFAQNALFDDFNVTSGDDEYYGYDEDGVRDPEVPEELVDLLEAFLVGLAPPPRNGTHPAGEQVFHDLGCAACHRPDLGPEAPGAYTNLCLHDMGPEYDGGGFDKGAGPRDYRTMPLWGLRHRVLFMHDGRAESVRDAILAHGGEAQASRDRYEALDEAPLADLHAFLDTL